MGHFRFYNGLFREYVFLCYTAVFLQSCLRCIERFQRWFFNVQIENSLDYFCFPDHFLYAFGLEYIVLSLFPFAVLGDRCTPFRGVESALSLIEMCYDR